MAAARRARLPALALALPLALALSPLRAWLAPEPPRRQMLLLPGLLGAPLPAGAVGFSPADIGMAEAPAPAQVQRVEDVDELEKALYLISRVQEATVQQERLVSTGKFKDVQRNSITMALNMMMDNYRLADQVVTAAGYVEPKENIVKASQVGNDAVEVLETAKEYFGQPLKVSGLTDEQRKFIIEAMQACRTKLDNFLVYVPEDVLQKARKRVEDENELNRQEYAGEDGGILNPVTLPWKEPKRKPR
ncbi:unnamed protein product [Durusdinium trenchii]|uniref:Uncharacterized protein n=1 Tax=Durusdinium trenchii TaxID=1381693 RepID=A0ABP0RRN9_9DINO